MIYIIIATGLILAQKGQIVDSGGWRSFCDEERKGWDSLMKLIRLGTGCGNWSQVLNKL